MVQTIEGNLLAADGKYAIVVSRFNDLVTSRLLDGAIDTLKRHGASEESITVVWVPGSFEIPLIADKLASSGDYLAVVCLGAVIQGETTHHEYINHQVAEGIRTVAQQSGVPVAFGVLTCQNLELALDRAGGRMGNKGHEAALAALETLATLRAIDDLATTQTAVAESRDDHTAGSTAGSTAGNTTGNTAGNTTGNTTGNEDEKDVEMTTTEDRPDPRRRQGREAALQALYQIDLNPEMPQSALGDFLDEEVDDPQLRAFAGQLLKGVTTRQAELDRRIESHSDNWSLERMAGTDRNILRLATWELLHSDVPFRVVLDEAVELAKTFGDARSPDFVNGVLDALVPETDRVPV